MKSTSIKCRLFVHSTEGVILDHFFVPVFLHILIWWDPCDPSLWSLEDVSPQHRHDILCKPQFCRFFLLFLKFNPILPNVVFKFLSLSLFTPPAALTLVWCYLGLSIFLHISAISPLPCFVLKFSLLSVSTPSNFSY